ncbi:hypothetical protein Agub_g417 [Astrephomene gubernaculifera]|uniref:Ribonuclease P/MRP protein subunit POP5 n=1 Tax=Astrephomene gubernaculifera TaxID=47775 RepID=A0AAD3DDN9_9CHLO|nr:hypothetical protein Agub_g417 [Astrephomene gubernaculifera]
MVRLKNRYLLLEISWKDGKLDESYNDNVLLQALRDSVALNFGDFGLGSNLSSLQVKYYSPYTDVGIVRCATAEHERVVAALALMTDVRQRPAAVRVLRVAGTLATCKEAAVARSAEKLLRTRLGRQHQANAEQLHQQVSALEL